MPSTVLLLRPTIHPQPLHMSTGWRTWKHPRAGARLAGLRGEREDHSSVGNSIEVTTNGKRPVGNPNHSVLFLCSFPVSSGECMGEMITGSFLVPWSFDWFPIGHDGRKLNTHTRSHTELKCSFWLQLLQQSNTVNALAPVCNGASAGIIMGPFAIQLWMHPNEQAEDASVWKGWEHLCRNSFRHLLCCHW